MPHTPRLHCFFVFLVGLLSSLCLANNAAAAEERQTQYVFLVTIDGMRPEEAFSGAEKRLIDKEIGGVADPEKTRAAFWREDKAVRREVLMPFLWSVVAKQGQLFGSVLDDCQVLVKNGRYFSYPGYQELLCGFPDEAVNSNDMIDNRNKTVLEWLNEKPELHGKIAAFASWNVLSAIINAKRSGIDVNAGWEKFDKIADPQRREQLNQAILETPRTWPNERDDDLTIAGTLAYLETHQPRVLYVSLGDTDEWCHAGRYDLYLEAARRSDDFLRALWDYAQNSDVYRGRTSLVVTVDHGRGSGREGWKNHSDKLPGSERVWIAALGPDIPAKGVRSHCDLSQGQVAATVAALLGYDYAASDPRIAPPLPGVIK